MNRSSGTRVQSRTDACAPHDATPITCQTNSSSSRSNEPGTSVSSASPGPSGAHSGAQAAMGADEEESSNEDAKPNEGAEGGKTAARRQEHRWGALSLSAIYAPAEAGPDFTPDSSSDADRNRRLDPVYTLLVGRLLPGPYSSASSSSPITAAFVASLYKESNKAATVTAEQVAIDLHQQQINMLRNGDIAGAAKLRALKASREHCDDETCKRFSELKASGVLRPRENGETAKHYFEHARKVAKGAASEPPKAGKPSAWTDDGNAVHKAHREMRQNELRAELLEELKQLIVIEPRIRTFAAYLRAQPLPVLCFHLKHCFELNRINQEVAGDLAADLAKLAYATGESVLSTGGMSNVLKQKRAAFPKKVVKGLDESGMKCAWECDTASCVAILVAALVYHFHGEVVQQIDAYATLVKSDRRTVAEAILRAVAPCPALNAVFHFTQKPKKGQPAIPLWNHNLTCYDPEVGLQCEARFKDEGMSGVAGHLKCRTMVEGMGPPSSTDAKLRNSDQYGFRIVPPELLRGQFTAANIATYLQDPRALLLRSPHEDPFDACAVSFMFDYLFYSFLVARGCIERSTTTFSRRGNSAHTPTPPPLPPPIQPPAAEHPPAAQEPAAAAGGRAGGASPAGTPNSRSKRGGSRQQRASNRGSGQKRKGDHTPPAVKKGRVQESSVPQSPSEKKKKSAATLRSQGRVAHSKRRLSAKHSHESPPQKKPKQRRSLSQPTPLGAQQHFVAAYTPPCEERTTSAPSTVLQSARQGQLSKYLAEDDRPRTPHTGAAAATTHSSCPVPLSAVNSGPVEESPLSICPVLGNSLNVSADGEVVQWTGASPPSEQDGPPSLSSRTTPQTESSSESSTVNQQERTSLSSPFSPAAEFVVELLLEYPLAKSASSAGHDERRTPLAFGREPPPGCRLVSSEHPCQTPLGSLLTPLPAPDFHARELSGSSGMVCTSRSASTSAPRQTSAGRWIMPPIQIPASGAGVGYLMSETPRQHQPFKAAPVPTTPFGVVSTPLLLGDDPVNIGCLFPVPGCELSPSGSSQNIYPLTVPS